MKTLLWLDDIRNPLENDWLFFSPIDKPYNVVWVKSFKEFVNWIELNGLPEGICFDHDLGDITELPSGILLSTAFESEKSGYDCAKWLVEYCINKDLDVPLYNIQSANPVGKANIDGLLKSYIKFRRK